MTKKVPAQPALAFSTKYTVDHALAYFEKHNTGIRRRLSNWREHQIARKALNVAGNPKSVLDVPCGTGRFWELLADKHDRIIYASDYSQDMIDTGLSHRPTPITAKINSVQASAFDLPFSDNFVECVFCMRLIHHMGEAEDRKKLLTELHRVCTSTTIISLWVDGNYQAWRRNKRETRRRQRTYQNRFVIPAATIEQEFVDAGYSITKHLDFIPGYSMWRVYVLKKR
jgi:ubiquinone/menaquinone biosynthesis C-methylase UbiE